MGMQDATNTVPAAAAVTAACHAAVSALPVAHPSPAGALGGQ